MGLQLRPMDPNFNARQSFYNPMRDVAVIGARMIHAAMVQLDSEEHWDIWFKPYFDAHGWTYEDMVSAAAKFAEALNMVVQMKNPDEAMQESGFSELPPTMQVPFYVEIGRVMLAAIWAGIKDQRAPDSAPPLVFKELLEDIERQLNANSENANRQPPQT